LQVVYVYVVKVTEGKRPVRMSYIHIYRLRRSAVVSFIDGRQLAGCWSKQVPVKSAYLCR